MGWDVGVAVGATDGAGVDVYSEAVPVPRASGAGPVEQADANSSNPAMSATIQRDLILVISVNANALPSTVITSPGLCMPTYSPPPNRLPPNILPSLGTRIQVVKGNVLTTGAIQRPLSGRFIPRI